MERVLTGFFVTLFFIGCACAGFFAGRVFPWWVLAALFGLAGLALLGRSRR